MRSMTGFGRGQERVDGVQACVEIAAVNRKQLDLRLTLPKEAAALEPVLRAHAQPRLVRGSYVVTVSVDFPAGTRPVKTMLDAAVIGAVTAQWRELARDLKLEPALTLHDVAAIPGAVVETQVSLVTESLKQAVLSAFDKALAAVQIMQEKEGAALRQDLEKTAARLGDGVARIQARADESLRYCRDRLRERIRLLGVELGADDERLAKEVAFWAERSDIHEEVTRLESHLDQLRETLAKEEPIGRPLDFICQEMTREINTLSAKTAETAVVHVALTLKAEVERLREQVQNVE